LPLAVTTTYITHTALLPGRRCESKNPLKNRAWPSFRVVIKKYSKHIFYITTRGTLKDGQTQFLRVFFLDSHRLPGSSVHCCVLHITEPVPVRNAQWDPILPTWDPNSNITKADLCWMSRKGQCVCATWCGLPRPLTFLQRFWRLYKTVEDDQWPLFSQFVSPAWPIVVPRNS
jgi:hypothetical protein